MKSDLIKRCFIYIDNIIEKRLLNILMRLMYLGSRTGESKKYIFAKIHNYKSGNE